MKSLKESILSDMDDILNNGEENIKEIIQNFLKQNYTSIYSFEISKKPFMGKYRVSGRGISVKNKDIEYLTNDLFEFDEVKLFFNCMNCKNLKSLKGLPTKLNGSLNISGCYNLESLEYIPKVVVGDIILSKNSNKKFTEDDVEKYVKNYWEIKFFN